MLRRRSLTGDVARCRHSEVLPAGGARIGGGVVGEGCDVEERVKRLTEGREEFIWIVCIIAQELIHGKHKHNTSTLSLIRMDVYLIMWYCALSNSAISGYRCNDNTQMSRQYSEGSTL